MKLRTAVQKRMATSTSKAASLTSRNCLNSTVNFLRWQLGIYNLLTIKFDGSSKEAIQM